MANPEDFERVSFIVCPGVSALLTTGDALLIRAGERLWWLRGALLRNRGDVRLDPRQPGAARFVPLATPVEAVRAAPGAFYFVEGERLERESLGEGRVTVSTEGLPGRLLDAVLAPDGETWLARHAYDVDPEMAQSRLAGIDARTGSVAALGTPTLLGAVELHRADPFALYAPSEQRLFRVDPRTRTAEVRFEDTENEIRALSVHPMTAAAAVVLDDAPGKSVVRIARRRTSGRDVLSDPVRVEGTPDRWLVRWHPKREVVAVAACTGDECAVTLLDERLRLAGRLEVREQRASDLAFSADGTHLYFGGARGVLVTRIPELPEEAGR